MHEHSQASSFQVSISEQYIRAGNWNYYSIQTCHCSCCNIAASKATRQDGVELCSPSPMSVLTSLEAIFNKNTASIGGGALNGASNVHIYVSTTSFNGNYAFEGGGANIKKSSILHLV